MDKPKFDLKAYLSERRQQVDTELDRILSQPTVPVRLADAMRYSVTAGGKRLRPILCMAAFDAVGGDGTGDILAVACALELIHTYSLIHDDLPAMDNDAVRRGQPTCHVAFDEATAILAGDALLTLAFRTLSAAGGADAENAVKRLAVIDVIAEAAGGSGMVGGQMLDMATEGQAVAFSQLENMQRMKTGALIQGAVRAGAMMGNAGAEQIDHLDVYAAEIGQAFQITDDILNVEGDPLRLGKAVGSDAARSKTTYPSLLGLAESKVLAQTKIDNALKALSIFDIRAEPLRAIARYIINRKR
jgi:geranylgeranyl diphosphate synthase type II